MAKTVLITGASSGIGLALAKMFARDGYDLVMVSQNEENLKKAEAEIKSVSKKITIYSIPMDLSLEGSAEELYKAVSDKSIRIDILVNNAGIQVYGNFHQVPLKDIERLMYLNMNTLVKLTGLFLADMTARGSGRILNLASTASFQPCPLNAVYCASKAFVLYFSEGIAEELAGTGITVTALCPGATSTNFAKRGNIEDTRYFKGRISSSDEVAAIGYKALMKGKRIVVVGAKNKLLAFSVRLVPRRMTTGLGKHLMQKI
ncbi:MAG: SDR family oxidoreductase [Clostridiaceae bacterium]|jgi:short-subunit dehydrogenase|nr:SDR family oxidoreductase [Clostridiaceae bacterium]